MRFLREVMTRAHHFARELGVGEAVMIISYEAGGWEINIKVIR
jgi:hypothetical protein